MLLLLPVLPFQCVEPFSPELKGNEELLVIEGIISNAPGPYVLKISTTSGVGEPFQKPLEGAQVSIIEQGGEEEQLVETKPGKYETSATGFQGVVGKSYKVSIKTPGGGEYESAFEKILPPEAIDSVYAAVESRIDLNYTHDLIGYQFYIDATVDNEENKYFLWKLTETYKFNVDLIIPFYYSGQILPFPDPDSLFTCYKTEDVRDIFTFSLGNLSEPRIQAWPLHYVDTQVKKLYLRYSLLTKQYTISKEAFEFWENIKKQNSGLGALYATQPFQIRGNMRNVLDEDEAVLGYFMAAGYSEKRIFVSRPSGVPFFYDICVLGEPGPFDFLPLYRSKPSSWPILLGQSPDGGAIKIAHRLCLDCTAHGATLEKPEFWTE